jgi:hypothetical protein
MVSQIMSDCFRLVRVISGYERRGQYRSGLMSLCLLILGKSGYIKLCLVKPR